MAAAGANSVDAGRRMSWAQPFTNEDAKDPHDAEGRLGCGVADAQETRTTRDAMTVTR
ncbi:hypothetical protein ACFZB9_18985 [Kitasatospora sp. NPDC008050]|uniref:hypothetical protein n=1 Tax=Kitasatospora sp. NPDC008050 TaxID=3364021 RepID=UPI0036F0A6A1